MWCRQALPLALDCSQGYCLNGVHEGFAVAGEHVRVENVPDCEAWAVLVDDYVSIKTSGKGL